VTEEVTDGDRTEAAARAVTQRDRRLEQLRWRSRRGLLELELLLLPFAAERLGSLDPTALDAYERLLGCEDMDVYDWLQGRANPADQSLDAIVRRIVEHATVGRA